MHLADDPAHTGFVSPHHYKKIFDDEAFTGQIVDNFNVCEPLLIGTYLVLALDDVNPIAAQDSPCFHRRRDIKV